MYRNISCLFCSIPACQIPDQVPANDISLIHGGYFDSDHAGDYEIYNFYVDENDKYHNGIIETGQMLYQKINMKDDSFDITYYNGQYTGYIKGLDDSIFDEVLEAFQNSVLNSRYYN